ncbi:glycine cleavage system protein T [Babesia caballi]|uniref:Glycine cleavage system protein T n=1 Tax=Babesia caballi TaxID=5871 RepID=A0AAV4LMW2_BABCB|nr:glycine cleavage system protein T [Babesia caballi]
MEKTERTLVRFPELGRQVHDALHDVATVLQQRLHSLLASAADLSHHQLHVVGVDRHVVGLSRSGGGGRLGLRLRHGNVFLHLALGRRGSVRDAVGAADGAHGMQRRGKLRQPLRGLEGRVLAHVVDLGLAEDHVGVGVGELVDIRLVHHEEHLLGLLNAHLADALDGLQPQLAQELARLALVLVLAALGGVAVDAPGVLDVGVALARHIVTALRHRLVNDGLKLFLLSRHCDAAKVPQMVLARAQGSRIHHRKWGDGCAATASRGASASMRAAT